MSEIGEKSGQEYDVAAAIKTFLGQMSEGGIDIAAAIIKELLQNADDAQATTVSVILDERTAPSSLPEKFCPIQSPALLVGNDASFKLPTEVMEGEKDDFSAIRSVASGHKAGQATSAGRFGIGFNSVYFITDNPVIFSRREIHIFDLLHNVFDVNGWKFSLDDFPSSLSPSAGPVKNVIQWIFPKIVANFERSFGDLAADSQGDYKRTLFRLPLRQFNGNGGAKPLFHQDFKEPNERLKLLRDMANQAAQAILFLNHVKSVSFGVLSENTIESVATIEITSPPEEFDDFLESVRTKSSTLEIAKERDQIEFDRSISYEIVENNGKISQNNWSFLTYHSARFDDPELHSLRKKLSLNDEKAIPWASLAVPLDKPSFNFGSNNGNDPFWRVFLPLLEEGPSGCVFSAALFVGPSRQRVEFVTSDGSDEALRKTNWNQKLVERALVPLLRDASIDMFGILQEFIKKFPKDYLSLFPISQDVSRSPKNLTEYLQRSFSDEPWCLQLYDIWDNKIEIMVGDEDFSAELEMVPEWLTKYRDCFEDLSDDSRHFIPFSIGDAVNKRLNDQQNISIIREVSPDVAKSVLENDTPPAPEDLVKLLKQLDLDEYEYVKNPLDGLWCLVRAQDKQLLRYDGEYLYISQSSEQRSPIHQCLQDLKFQFNETEWIDPQYGIPATKQLLLQSLGNVVPADDDSALKLLSRVTDGLHHDRVKHSSDIVPIINFLCSLDETRPLGDLQLGFLVKTAHGKGSRRDKGVILLKPTEMTKPEDAIWEGIFRRTYPEVDSDFSREINRLLSTRPDCLKMLHSPDCKVFVANEENCIGIFNASRKNYSRPELFKEFIDQIENEINGNALKKGLSQMISATIIEKADKIWETAESFEKETILALPIHRLATDEYTSIKVIGNVDDSSSVFPFRLQSTDDDLVDAPITLPKVKLLHHGDRIATRFYRDRINLEEHGRAAVLKDTLHQIGSEDANNQQLLQYVAKYFEDTVELLTHSSEPGHKKDASELKDLFASASLIPCTDGLWRPIEKCQQAWDIAEKLKKQRWKKKELNDVLTDLFSPQAIATLSPQERKLIEKICELPVCEEKEIAKYAVLSDSTNFGLDQRIKIISENWIKSVSDHEPSEFLRSQEVATLSGKCELENAEVLDDSCSKIPKEVARHFVPQTIDLAAFAEEYNLPPAKAYQVLSAFGVKNIAQNDLDEIIVSDFADVWSKIISATRFQLLAYVGQSEKLIEELSDKILELDIACISIKEEEWCEPENIVAPFWRKTNPPLLPANMLISDECNDSFVQNVWNNWCGLNSAEKIINEVISAASDLEENKKKQGAKALYSWFEIILSEELISTDELIKQLSGLKWILARNDDEMQFLEPSDVLLHKGQDVLQKGFWVPACELPQKLKSKRAVFGFKETLSPDEETIETLAFCLASATRKDPDALASVYALTEELLSQKDELEAVWREESQDKKVFSLFRSQESKVNNIQLFTGSKTFSEDIGDLLFCLKATKKLPNKMISLYGKLGVAKVPTADQLLWALSNLTGEFKKVEKTYDRIVESLVSLKTTELSPHVFNFDLHILSCARTVEAMQDCYFDDDLGKPANIEEGGRKYLINSKNRATSKLLNWLETNLPEKIIQLSGVASIELQHEPNEIGITPLVSKILGPWKDFIHEVTREDSLLREELDKKGINVPQFPVEITAVENLSIQFHTRDGQVICPSDKWNGLPAYFDKSNNIFVQYPFMEKIKTDSFSYVAKLDKFIAKEVLEWLAQDGHSCELLGCAEIIDLILNNLERPSILLSQIRKDNQRHFFHQYNDQVADPKFAALFEQHRKTREGSTKFQQLEEQMEKILLDKNVKARREDIRGYGYDEFSVFAELVQNAEDAYVQRDWLKMDDPPNFTVAFKYQYESEEKNLILTLEHYGRPFNYWRHGTLENENLKRDVEGVLRSKGSYKPHGDDTSDEKTIGRFGLGFKSVFLITDRPIVHSENWHFAIEACCLPKELVPPADLPQGATRIVLPLNTHKAEIEDSKGRRLINFVPFLKKIDSLDLERSDKSNLNLAINKKDKNTSASTGVIVEKICISGTSHTRGEEVCFLRFRHPDHDGQLAICISDKMLPVPWDEAFNSDFYVALPIKVKLGCGVAISHLFELQSGRTHLIEHDENTTKIQEVAGLISALPTALEMLPHDDSNCVREVLLHFWSLWRWDIGDSEGSELRKALAKQLVFLAKKNKVVPTQRDGDAAFVGDNVLFYFSQNIPDDFISALIEFNIEFQDNEEKETPLTPDNVVPPRFAKSFIETCKFADLDEPDNFIRVTWEKIGETLAPSDYFSEFPELFNTLAECLPISQHESVLEWLPECLLRGVDGVGNRQSSCPEDLVRSDCTCIENLPKRLLSCLDLCYSKKAVELLLEAGLLERPTVEQFQEWLTNKELTFDECIGILAYLAEDGRFRIYYHSLKHLMATPWIPHANGFLTISQAKEEELLDTALFEDDEFIAWLGLWEGGSTEEPIDEIIQPDFNAQAWLEKLFDWWLTNGDNFTSEYEKGVYPQGRSFDLQTDFFSNDRSARREWLSLFLLGSFHTMGWYKPGAHRNFLTICENKGWLQVFADPDFDAARWVDVLESYLDGQIGEAKYYHWVKQFVSIFQLARWLDGYVDLFLDLGNYKKDFSMNDLLISRESVIQQPGGVDAPPLTKALGIGANFVIRELMRNRIIEQPLAHRHSFVPISRVRNIMKRLGCEGLDERSGTKTNQSMTIHEFLVEHLGEDRATFNNSFDLPLLAVADGKAPMWDLPLTNGTGERHDLYSRVSFKNSGEWVTLPDGRKVPLS